MTHVPVVDIKDTDFRNAWARLVSQTLRVGVHYNGCTWVNSTVVIEGKGIEQVANKVVHPDYPFHGNQLNEYVKQMTKIGVSEFEYTYGERLAYPLVDAKINFYDPRLWRRLVAHTWISELDMIPERSAPCLQYIQIIPMPDEEMMVELTWRSRDVYTAWMANIIALYHLIDHHGILDYGKVVAIVDKCGCAHVYDTDRELAKKVKVIPTYF